MELRRKAFAMMPLVIRSATSLVPIEWGCEETIYMYAALVNCQLWSLSRPDSGVCNAISSKRYQPMESFMDWTVSWWKDRYIVDCRGCLLHAETMYITKNSSHLPISEFRKHENGLLTRAKVDNNEALDREKIDRLMSLLQVQMVVWLKSHPWFSVHKADYSVQYYFVSLWESSKKFRGTKAKVWLANGAKRIWTMVPILPFLGGGTGRLPLGRLTDM